MTSGLDVVGAIPRTSSRSIFFGVEGLVVMMISRDVSEETSTDGYSDR